VTHVRTVAVEVVTILDHEVLSLLLLIMERQLIGGILLRLAPLVTHRLIHQCVIAFIHVQVVEVLPLTEPVVAEDDNFVFLLLELELIGRTGCDVHVVAERQLLLGGGDGGNITGGGSLRLDFLANNVVDLFVIDRVSFHFDRCSWHCEATLLIFDVLEHGAVDFGEVSDAAYLLTDLENAATDVTHLMLAFVVIWRVDEITLVGQVVHVPVANTHVITARDCVVACDSALCHVRAEARDEDLAAGIRRLIS